MPETRRDRRAMINIRFMQKSSKSALECTFKKTTFKNLVRELGDNLKMDLRCTELSFVALSEAAHAYLVKLFEDADRCRDHAIHAERKKVRPSDFQLVRRLQLLRL
jgi:histone H3-like centromeric protein A